MTMGMGGNENENDNDNDNDNERYVDDSYHDSYHDSSKPEQIPPVVSDIFNHWNGKDIISHKSLTKEIFKRK